MCKPATNIWNWIRVVRNCFIYENINHLSCRTHRFPSNRTPLLTRDIESMSRTCCMCCQVRLCNSYLKCTPPGQVPMQGGSRKHTFQCSSYAAVSYIVKLKCIWKHQMVCWCIIYYIHILKYAVIVVRLTAGSAYWCIFSMLRANRMIIYEDISVHVPVAAFGIPIWVLTVEILHAVQIFCDTDRSSSSLAA